MDQGATPEISSSASKRFLFEFEDLSWFPDNIRRGMVDYLSFFLRKTDFYKPVVSLIAESLERSGSDRIVDICSGGGGPMRRLSQLLTGSLGYEISITLTDKFPNIDAWTWLQEQSGNSIGFERDSVDATMVPRGLRGVLTCFSALHHFSPDGIKAILSSAAKDKRTIAFFDGGDRNLLTMLGIALVHPIVFIFCTPFLKPFRVDRLLLTYLLPLIPICTVWDGLVSICRLYGPSQLEEIAREADKDYVWISGKKKHPLGFHIAYLIGYPQQLVNEVGAFALK